MENNQSKAYYESPAGLIGISASHKGVVSLLFVKKRSGRARHNAHTSACYHQLHEYFNKERTAFDLPLDLQGTEFQKKVWHELMRIPFGKTVSYLELAKRLGDRKCIRAAGTANGRNPVGIIIPCHRVIGSNGDLVGYGGGLDKKKWLLEFEGALVQQELFV